LAQYCLPAAQRDEYRRLAWANSIVALFIVIGLVGLKPPKIEEKVLPPPQEVVPVVIITPEDQKEPEPEELPDEVPEPTSQPDMQTPQVVTVVARDPATVAFAVPVTGPVAFAPAAIAQAPPRIPPKVVTAPKPITYRRGSGEAGNRPEPPYPRQEILDKHSGNITLLITVETNGIPADVQVKDGCGFSCLDRHVLQWVKRHWTFAEGERRSYVAPFEFQLK
jgi:TonB family protein